MVFFTPETLVFDISKVLEKNTHFIWETRRQDIMNKHHGRSHKSKSAGTLIEKTIKRGNKSLPN